MALVDRGKVVVCGCVDECWCVECIVRVRQLKWIYWCKYLYYLSLSLFILRLFFTLLYFLSHLFFFHHCAFISSSHQTSLSCMLSLFHLYNLISHHYSLLSSLNLVLFSHSSTSLSPSIFILPSIPYLLPLRSFPFLSPLFPSFLSYSLFHLLFFLLFKFLSSGTY